MLPKDDRTASSKRKDNRNSAISAVMVDASFIIKSDNFKDKIQQ